jgi:hypothetical protein
MIRQNQEMIRIQIRKKEFKSSPFTDDMILHIDYPKDPLKTITANKEK